MLHIIFHFEKNTVVHLKTNRLNYMHDFMQNFKNLVIFNTIANHTQNKNPDGLTHNDILEMDSHIPRTRISRLMNRLTNDGFLEEKEIKTEIGRPKKYYSLTEKGKTHHAELKENLRNMYEKISERLMGDLSVIDIKKMPGHRFNPIHHILESDESIEEQIQHLTDHEEELQDQLKLISKAKKELKQKLSSDTV